MTSAARVVAVVLAGGASTRFGGDKLTALLDGRPLLHHALEAAGAFASGIVLVVAPDKAALQLPAGLDRRIMIARDPSPHAGPLAGLQAGLAAIRAVGAPDDPIVVVIGGDMPTVRVPVVRLLVEHLHAHAGLVAVTLEAPDPSPLPMAIRLEALGAVATVLQARRRSLLALLDAVPSDRVPADRWRALDPTGETLRDVDRPSDL